MEVEEDPAIDSMCSEIRRLLDQAVRRCIRKEKMGIMLSGGLDASVVAAIASKYTNLTAYTIALKGAWAPDVEASSLVTRTFGIDHKIHYIDYDELASLISPVVKILHSFDPIELHNSLALYSGMLIAKKDGMKYLFTGDGSDELMIGYNFIIDLQKEELDAKLKKMWNMLAFSAVPIAASLGMTTVTPYLDQDFKNYAMSIDSGYKIRKKGSLIFGKWILRKAFENILPKEIAWRTKAPIQCGSGTITLSEYFNSKISDADYKEKKDLYRKKDHVMLYDKEQLAYYEIFRSVVGVQKKKWLSLTATCPQCNSELSPFLDFCHTCGSTKIPIFNVPHYGTK